MDSLHKTAETAQNVAANAVKSASERLNATTEYAKEAVAGGKKEVKKQEAQDSSASVGDRLSAGTSSLKEDAKEQMHGMKGDAHKNKA